MSVNVPIFAERPSSINGKLHALAGVPNVWVSFIILQKDPKWAP